MTMRTTTGPRRTSSAARRLALAAAGLVLLTATVLVGTRAAPQILGSPAPADAPRIVGAPSPADPARDQEQQDQEHQGRDGRDVRDVPDDPRLRDDHVDPFDDDHPSIAGLRSGLRAALQDAARDAEAQGIDVWVTSGRRSVAYQQELLDEAVRRYGSLSEALRFVASPDTSKHVTGDAVDIGPAEADDWLIRHGADYGLCQTYANEIWHFELATEPGGRCPAPRPDAAG